MQFSHSKQMMTARLVDSLYTEAMVLADEARSYFDATGRPERDALTPLDRVAFSCESLKVTTRLMHVIAWLLTRKAIATGELAADSETATTRQLGRSAATDPATLLALPPGARELIAASIDLYERIERIDHDMAEPGPDSPARGLIRRIERTL